MLKDEFARELLDALELALNDTEAIAAYVYNCIESVIEKQVDKNSEMERVILGSVRDGVYINQNYWWEELKKIAMGIKDKWIITVGGGYGDFEFTGTEKEAEDMRYNKAKSEGAPAIKHRAPTQPWHLIRKPWASIRKGKIKMDERFVTDAYLETCEDEPEESDEEAMKGFYAMALEMHKDHGNHGSLSFETCSAVTCVMAREWKDEYN